MSVLNPKDIVKHGGDVKAALEEKRGEAAQHLAATKSMPEWWDLGVSLGSVAFKSKRGPPKKFLDEDELFSIGLEYFERCADKDSLPTLGGLVLALGFSNTSQFYAHGRRNPELREAIATLLHMLTIPLEMEIPKPGGQAGKMFLLKNIPEGLLPEDNANTPMKYAWHDKHQTELSGPGGASITISRKLSPEEAYMQMLEGGVLEDEPAANAANEADAADTADAADAADEFDEGEAL